MRLYRVLISLGIFATCACSCKTGPSGPVAASKQYPFTDTIRLSLVRDSTAIPVVVYARHFSSDSVSVIGGGSIEVAGAKYQVIAADMPWLSVK